MTDSRPEYWQIQQQDQPLFPDLIWSQPQNKNQAGKLLLIGGNMHGFSALAKTYEASIKAGIGTARVLMPDKLKPIVSSLFKEADYCPSTPSGSFARTALANLLDYSGWADCVLLAGDFGKNSETAIMLEGYLDKYSGLLTITQDGLDYFVHNPETLITRKDTLMVGTMSQLQKISIKTNPNKLITLGSNLLQLIQALHELTEMYPLNIITYHLSNIVVASKGFVSSTKVKPDINWQVRSAASASVWLLQQKSQPFEALTTSMYKGI